MQKINIFTQLEILLKRADIFLDVFVVFELTIDDEGAVAYIGENRGSKLARNVWLVRALILIV